MGLTNTITLIVMKMRKKSLTKEQRQIQIQQWFTGRIQEDNDTSLASLAQIARGLGLSPSSHLRSLCEALVNDDILICESFTRSGRWQGRGYRLSKSAYTRPKNKNVVVNFRVNGKQIREEFSL